jgi:hypothetical protein
MHCTWRLTFDGLECAEAFRGLEACQNSGETPSWRLASSINRFQGMPLPVSGAAPLSQAHMPVGYQLRSCLPSRLPRLRSKRAAYGEDLHTRSSESSLPGSLANSLPIRPLVVVSHQRLEE